MAYESVYKNVHTYGVTVSKFVPPTPIPVGAAHRLSDTTMNVLGAAETLTVNER